MKMDEMNDLRVSVLETARAMNACGINHGSSGNVSLRLDDVDDALMLITPSALPYHRCTPQDMVVVRRDGGFYGPRPPSSEWRMHRDIYLAYETARCILHAHAPWCSTLACLERGIPSQHYMVAMAGGPDIRCTPYAPFGSQELSDVAVEGLRGRKAVLLGHHGLLCYADNPEQALALACEVEFLARVYAQSLAITPDPPLLSESDIANLAERFAGYRKLGK